MKRLAMMVGAAALAIAPAPARAEWYGWQTLGTDVGSVLLVGGGLSQESLPVAIGGGLGFVLGAPIVHAAHGHWTSAGISVGMRAAVPVLAVFGGGRQ